MQADRRFVEHIQHAAQAAAHLAGQANALGFAAGKRRRRPGERQIFQPDVDQELHAVVNFADQLAGDLLLGRGRASKRRQSASSLPSGKRQISSIVRPRKPHGRGVVAQPGAAAGRAIDFVDQMIQLAAQAGRQARPLLPGPDTAPCIESGTRRADRALRASASPLRSARGQHVDPLARPAVQIDPPLLAAKLLERHIDRHAGAAAQGRRASRRTAAFDASGPQGHGALGQRQFRIVKQRRRIRAGLRAQAFARRAPAQRTVERKTVRRERLEAAPALVAGKMLAVNFDPPARLRHVVDADRRRAARRLPMAKRGFDAAGDPRAAVGPDRRPDRSPLRPDACAGDRWSAAGRPNRSVPSTRIAE